METLKKINAMIDMKMIIFYKRDIPFLTLSDPNELVKSSENNNE